MPKTAKTTEAKSNAPKTTGKIKPATKAPKVTGKAALKAAAAKKEGPVTTPVISGEPMVRPEDAAMAAASTANIPKNFRNHPDMENFYRFIYEHDLRLEALEIIDQIITARSANGGAIVKSSPKAALSVGKKKKNEAAASMVQ